MLYILCNSLQQQITITTALQFAYVPFSISCNGYIKCKAAISLAAIKKARIKCNMQLQPFKNGYLLMP